MERGRARSRRSSPTGSARLGLEVELYEAAPGRPNVVGVARGSGGGGSLLLDAHMDTVGVAGMESPFVPPSRKDACTAVGRET